MLRLNTLTSCPFQERYISAQEEYEAFGRIFSSRVDSLPTVVLPHPLSPTGPRTRPMGCLKVDIIDGFDINSFFAGMIGILSSTRSFFLSPHLDDDMPPLRPRLHVHHPPPELIPKLSRQIAMHHMARFYLYAFSVSPPEHLAWIYWHLGWNGQPLGGLTRSSVYPGMVSNLFFSPFIDGNESSRASGIRMSRVSEHLTVLPISINMPRRVTPILSETSATTETSCVMIIMAMLSFS